MFQPQPQYISQPTYPAPRSPQVAQQPQPFLPPRVQTPPPPQIQPGPLAQQPVLPMVARGKIDDEPPSPLATNTKLPPLHLPSPEELGLAPTANAPQAVKVDWNAIRERLERLGAVSIQTTRLSDGRWRVGFVLRTNTPNQFQHIEATAATEADAVAAALARAEAAVAMPLPGRCSLVPDEDSRTG